MASRCARSWVRRQQLHHHDRVERRNRNTFARVSAECAFPHGAGGAYRRRAEKRSRIRNESVNLALFDFDGTITSSDTWTPFIRMAVRPSRLRMGVVVLIPVMVGYRLGMISSSRGRRVTARVAFTGEPADCVRQHGERYASSVLPGTLQVRGLERLEWHRSQGDHIVVVSASLDAYLIPWCRERQLECICTRLRGTRRPPHRSICRRRLHGAREGAAHPRALRPGALSSYLCLRRQRRGSRDDGARAQKVLSLAGDRELGRGDGVRAPGPCEAMRRGRDGSGRERRDACRARLACCALSVCRRARRRCLMHGLPTRRARRSRRRQRSCWRTRTTQSAEARAELRSDRGFIGLPNELPLGDRGFSSMTGSRTRIVLTGFPGWVVRICHRGSMCRAARILLRCMRLLDAVAVRRWVRCRSPCSGHVRAPEMTML